jgi:hypothetical protein
VQKQYTCPLDPEFALDKFHESWKVFFGFPARRSIEKDAAIANSVVLRCEHDLTWRPQNLIFLNGALASGYQIVNVVGQPLSTATAKSTGSQSAGA